MRPVAVYRLLDDTGGLLYIGASIDPAGRVATHRRYQPWGSTIAQCTTDWFESPEQASAVERRAIAAEHPVHNRVTGAYPPAQRAGYEPTVTLTITLPAELVAVLRESARDGERQLSAEIRRRLRQTIPAPQK